MRRWSIATRLLALQFVVILGLTAAAVALIWADARADVERDAAARSLAVAETIAQDPFTLEGVTSADPSATLQPYAVAVMEATGIDFVTIMSTDGIRYTHRDPAEIGKPFLGTIDRALAGEAFTETYTGTLGPSVRAVVPIEDSNGQVQALIAAGITVSNTQVALGGRIGTVLIAAALALLVGGAASWALSRYLRRVTGGRGAEEMSRMFAYYEGVLHAIGEGLVLQDDSRRVVLYNDRAAEMLGLPPIAARRGGRADPVPLADLALTGAVAEVLAGVDPVVDQILITPTHVLVVDRDRIVAPRGRAGVTGSGRAGRAGRRNAPGFAGTVTTVRDHTKLQELTGELATLTTLSDALRSQAHEFANRLHTMIALIELDRPAEAAELAAGELGLSQQLADRILTAIDEPVLMALLLGKSAQAAERGIALEVSIPEPLTGGSVPPRELITIVGNLLDNAMDAVGAAGAVGGDAVPGAPNGRVTVTVQPLPAPDAGLRIEVSDSGPGPDPQVAATMFDLGRTTKAGDSHGIGLALARQAVNRLHGSLRVDGSAFTVTLPNTVEPARTPVGRP
ncbi:ATP-binding protein [Herbiconiux sp.]|uniref:sensor histidine kinase n=1 Tax=Herbiconiux sp. TaxID=1871186 RepID=UPI0025BBBE5E|nr:ATP-binding protein [Herbiconiux sp.]